MNGQFQVAQASGAGGSSNNSPARVFKLTKPLTDQAVMINLGYDQKVQVDFSAIANEKITLVHVGEKLIILFDNQSTVTVEPFFDSRHDALQNLTIEIAPGRDLSVTEFASTFPITTDQSVLPAAGNANGNAQASGAHFDSPAVDPLALPNPLPLLPQEDLPGFVITNPTGTDVLPINPPSPILPTIVANLFPGLAIDESFLTVGTNLIPGSTPNLASTVATGLAPFTVDAPAGQQSLTFALSISAAGADPGLIDSQTGNHVFLFLESGVVVGREGPNAATAASGLRDFTLSVDSTGHITLTDLRSVHHSNAHTPDDSLSLNAGVVTLTATVTDLNNASASASIDVGPHLTIIDDGSTAHADTDATAVGQFTPELGNVITAVGTTSTGVDVLGADGAVVSGVAAGNTNADLDSAATLNTAIQGTYGKLTLLTDGSYSYVRDAGTAGGHDDVFTYTLKDGDGDLSHTTLTISVGDSTPTDVIPAAGGATTTVFEKGLAARGAEPAGSGEIADGNPSNNSDGSETVAGTIAFTSLDGVSAVSLGGHLLSGAAQTLAEGTTRPLTAAYTYNTGNGAGGGSPTHTPLDK